MTRQTRIVLALFVLFAVAGIYLLTMPGLAAASTPTSIAGASQRYVNGTTGVDGTGDCTNTAGNPICKTIEYALSRSIAGSVTVSDTINIYPDTYSLASTLVITKYIILQGTTSNGLDVRIDGHLFAGSGPVIHAEQQRLTINNLTIQNGNAGVSGLGGGILVSGTSAVTIRNSFIMSNKASAGGGIYTNNSSSVFIIRSQFAGNSATGNGGAIFGGVGASTVITSSAIISNTAANGGGIYNQGPLTVVNSTIGDNGVPVPISGNGGGLYTTGTGATVSLNNATIFNNQAAGSGGGIFANSGTVTVQNTIVAMNTAAAGSNCSGTVTNAGFNLDSGATCGWGTTNGSKSSTDPLLGPLTSHGSYTMYRMPQSTPTPSPAINAGNNVTGCTDGSGHLLTVDQRNAVRPQPQGGRCDIGSVEFGNAPSLASISPTSVMAGTGDFAMTLTGANFPVTNPKVLWVVNGLTTTFTTTNMFTHTTTLIGLNVQGNFIAFPDTVQIAVQNPSGTGNISGALPFTILPNPSQKFLYLPLVMK